MDGLEVSMQLIELGFELVSEAQAQIQATLITYSHVTHPKSTFNVSYILSTKRTDFLRNVHIFYETYKLIHTQCSRDLDGDPYTLFPKSSMYES